MLPDDGSHGLGRLYQRDERDDRHPMRQALDPAAPLPAYRYWNVPGVLDQNGYGVCVGAAWSAWLRCSPIRTLTGPDMFAIYKAAILVDEWPGNDNDAQMQFGTSVRAGAKVLEAQGRIAEYLWARDVDTLRRWLLTRGPVVMGTEWYEGMFTTDAAGFVRRTGGVAGGHAYLATGYSTARLAFRCVNSWARSWGQSGRFWIADTDMAALLASDGEACAAVERQPV